MADGFLPPIVISVALADAPALAGLAGLKGAVADTAASIDVSTAAASKSVAGMGAGAATGAEAIGVNAAKAGKSLEGMGAGAVLSQATIDKALSDETPYQKAVRASANAERDITSQSKGFAGRMAMMFESAGNSMGSFGLPFGNSVKKMGYAMKEGESGAKGFGASLMGLSKIASLASLAIGGVLVAAALKAADATDAANARLMTAAQDTGKSMVGVEGGFLKAEKAGVKLGFMTDETAESLAKLTVATKSPTEAIERQSLAENLSAMRKVSLGTATDALTKLYAGSTRALTAMGVQMNIGSLKMTAQAKDTEALTKAKTNLKTAEEGMAAAVKKGAEEHEKAEARVTAAQETLSGAQRTLAGGSESLAAAQHTLTEAQKGVAEAAEKEKTAIAEASKALKAAEESAREAAETGAKGIEAAKSNLSKLEQERAKEGNEAGIKTIEGEEKVLEAVKTTASEAALAQLKAKRAALEAADKGMEAQKKEAELQTAHKGIIEAEATAHKNDAKAMSVVEAAHKKLEKAQKDALSSSKQNVAAANKLASAHKGLSSAERTLTTDEANVHKATDALKQAQTEAAAPPKALAAAQEKLKKAHEAVSTASKKLAKDSGALGQVLSYLSKVSMGQAQKQAETTAGKLLVMKAVMNEAAADIGKKLEPVLAKLSVDLTKLIGFFQKNSVAAKGLALALGLAAVAWPIAKVVGFVSALSKLLMLGKLATLAKGVATSFGLIGVAEGEAEVAGAPLIGMFGSIALAIGGAVAAAEVFSRLLGKGSFIENVKQLLGGGDAKVEHLEAETRLKEGINTQRQAELNARREKEGKKPVMFAAGGIVTKPTLAMIGEAGPEAIIPLASGGLSAPAGVAPLPSFSPSGSPTAGTSSSGGLTVQNLTVNGMATPNAQVVQELYRALRPLLQSA